MAYPEKRGNGKRPWRVKYMTPTGERSRSGFETEQDAQDWGDQQERDIRAKRWNDPRKGDKLLKEWVAEWANGQDLAETTAENYRYHLRAHILPAFGDRALASLDRLEIDAWQAGIRRRKYAASSAAKARSLLATILDDAIEARYISSNPAHKKRGRGRQDIYAEAEESLWFTPEQALTIAERVGLLAGRPDEFVMVILAAYTGMRFGEVRGLQREYAQLGSVKVHWQLREVRGRYIKAPPKHNGRRAIPLPPFLTDLMSAQLARSKARHCGCGSRRLPDCENHLPRLCGCDDHQGDFIFRPGSEVLDHHSRTGFASQFFRLAADGRLIQKGNRPRARIMVDGAGRYVMRRQGETFEKTAARAVATWLPVGEGITFHDSKHSHKTWMIGDGIPEVAQFERLGHRLGGVRGIYSHVEPEMRVQIVEALQRRWEKALKRRARMGASRLPILQELLEPHLGPWELISQIPPIGGAKIIEMRKDQAV